MSIISAPVATSPVTDLASLRTTARTGAGIAVRLPSPRTATGRTSGGRTSGGRTSPANPRPAARPAAHHACRHCGSKRTLTVAMLLTDGTPVEFTACRGCEGKSWMSESGPLELTHVLARATKIR